MNKIIFRTPEQNESPEEICLHNLKTADKFFNSNYFIAASHSWFRLNPGSNFQHFENFLRNNNFNTHLCAAPPQPVNIPNLSHLRAQLTSISRNISDDAQYKYECIYSCKPHNYALAEVLTYWPSYEQNFNNLKYTGSFIIKNTGSSTDLPDVQVKNNDLQNDLQNDYTLIAKNLKKIFIEKLSISNYLMELQANCEKKFNKKAEWMQISITQTGAILTGLVIDNKLASDIGYVMEYQNNKIITRLITFKISPKTSQ